MHNIHSANSGRRPAVYLRKFNNNDAEKMRNFLAVSINPLINGHIKIAEQLTIIDQCSDWYTDRWWVGCYTWYSEEGPGRAAQPAASPTLAVGPISGECTNPIGLLLDVAL